MERILAGLGLSGREDSNLRPFGPEPNALPGCATPRYELHTSGGIYTAGPHLGNKKDDSCGRPALILGLVAPPRVPGHSLVEILPRKRLADPIPVRQPRAEVGGLAACRTERAKRGAQVRLRDFALAGGTVSLRQRPCHTTRIAGPPSRRCVTLSASEARPSVQRPGVRCRLPGSQSAAKADRQHQLGRQGLS